MPGLEGWDASERPELVAPRHTGCAGAHLKSCRDEPGDCEAIRTSEILERAQLRCLYTTVHSAGSKQEEMEATVLLKTVTYLSFLRWDECHDWGAAIDGYRLCRRDR